MGHSTFAFAYDSAWKKNGFRSRFFYAAVFFTVLIEKKSVSYFIGEIFDSDARSLSSLKIYPENPSSWTILAVF